MLTSLQICKHTWIDFVKGSFIIHFFVEKVYTTLNVLIKLFFGKYDLYHLYVHFLKDGKHAERLIYSLKQSRQEYDAHLVTMAKAWLECGRDMRFMPSSKND